MGMKNGKAALEDSLADSYKMKRIVSIGFSNCVPWHISKQNENLLPHKNLHADVYICFIHYLQNLEQPRCPSVFG